MSLSTHQAKKGEGINNHSFPQQLKTTSTKSITDNRPHKNIQKKIFEHNHQYQTPSVQLKAKEDDLFQKDIVQKQQDEDELLQGYFKKPIQKQEKSNINTTTPIQRMINVFLHTNDDDKKTIVAEGKVKEFKGGSTAGKNGWIGVDKYRSRYTIWNNKGYENTGDVGPLKNYYTNPEAGHVLAKQNGGNGKDSENIFAQDGGTNNSTYKSFENDMRKDLNLYKNNDNVEFVSYLVGDEITEGYISDAYESSASDISSDDDL